MKRIRDATTVLGLLEDGDLAADFSTELNGRRDTMRKWILRDGTLCLDGYPIRILSDNRGGCSGGMPFNLVSDFHGTSLGYMTLGLAKQDANRMADEIDEFTPPVSAKA